MCGNLKCLCYKSSVREKTPIRNRANVIAIKIYWKGTFIRHSKQDTKPQLVEFYWIFSVGIKCVVITSSVFVVFKETLNNAFFFFYFYLAGAYVGQPQMQFAPQCFGPTTAGAPPTAMMSAMTLINGGYMGLQQQQGGPPANQGPNMYNLQQGQQWSMSMVTHF